MFVLLSVFFFINGDINLCCGVNEHFQPSNKDVKISNHETTWNISTKPFSNSTQCNKICSFTRNEVTM